MSFKEFVDYSKEQDTPKENEEHEYNPVLDLAVRQMAKLNIKKLTLKDIDKLAKSREIKRSNLIQDATYNAALYEVPPDQQQGGGLM